MLLYFRGFQDRRVQATAIPTAVDVKQIESTLNFFLMVFSKSNLMRLV